MVLRLLRFLVFLEVELLRRGETLRHWIILVELNVRFKGLVVVIEGRMRLIRGERMILMGVMPAVEEIPHRILRMVYDLGHLVFAVQNLARLTRTIFIQLSCRNALLLGFLGEEILFVRHVRHKLIGLLVGAMPMRTLLVHFLKLQLCFFLPL